MVRGSVIWTLCFGGVGVKLLAHYGLLSAVTEVCCFLNAI